MCMINLTQNHISYHRSATTPVAICRLEAVPDNNLSLSANIVSQTIYGSRFALTSRQHVLLCYVYMLCLRHNTAYSGWHSDTCFESRQIVNKAQGNTFRQKANKKQQNFILNICRYTLMALYTRSNDNAEMNLVGNYQMLRGLCSALDRQPYGVPSKLLHTFGCAMGF